MIETFQDFLTWLRDVLAWMPDALAGAIILVVAALAALLAYSVVSRLIRRITARRHPYLASVLAGIPHLGRLAFLIVALFMALSIAPFGSSVTAGLAHILLLAGIVLAGWIAITAIHIAADLYLKRFRLDVEDNLLARKHVTQVRVMLRVIDTLLIIITISAALMTFEAVRNYGVSLFASAGVAGLVVGLAARPVLSNLIAGIQLAVTQPIRIEDAVVVENESGRVEEITSTYVVLRLWDMRRMVVPLSHFIEKPFQNWTRDSTNQIGTILLNVDYSTPVDRVRDKAIEIVKASPLWDGVLAKLQVTDATETSIQIRVLASARSSGDAFDLRCQVREQLIEFLQRELPGSLPRLRQENLSEKAPQPRTAAAKDDRSPQQP